MGELIRQPHGGALMPPIKPGEVRNPEGRKTYSAYVKEHWNSLALKIEKNELTFDDLKYIAENDVNTNRRAAAMRIIRSVDSLDEFKELMDRTGGKSSGEIPSVTVNVLNVLKVEFDK